MSPRLEPNLVMAVAAVGWLAGCAAMPPPPPETHRCVEIPSGLVECSELPRDHSTPSAQ